MLCREGVNIRLKLAYDGTDFSGWQRQAKGTRTVQGLVEEALEKIHKKPVALTGSGRTDTGVHAAAQTANFYTSIQSMEASRFVPALNSLLPRDVRVLEAEKTSEDFHARFDARLRTYRYFFIPGFKALPWEQRYAWRLKRYPDITRLNSYARVLRGEMDFTAFAVPGDKSKSRHRYIFSACFFPEGNRLVFEISANAFLWKMVRSLAGTLINFEEKGFSADYFREVLLSRNRQLAGPTAPAEGLFLWNIEYGLHLAKVDGSGKRLYDFPR